MHGARHCRSTTPKTREASCRLNSGLWWFGMSWMEGSLARRVWPSRPSRRLQLYSALKWKHLRLQRGKKMTNADSAFQSLESCYFAFGAQHGKISRFGAQTWVRCSGQPSIRIQAPCGARQGGCGGPPVRHEHRGGPPVRHEHRGGPPARHEHLCTGG